MSHDKHVRYDWSIRDGVISTSLVVMGLDAVQINQGHDVVSPDAVWTGLRQRPGRPGRPGRRERTSTKRERNDRAHDTSRDVKSHVMRKEKKTSARPGATVSTRDSLRKEICCELYIRYISHTERKGALLSLFGCEHGHGRHQYVGRHPEIPQGRILTSGCNLYVP